MLGVGLAFVRWHKIVLKRYAAKLVIPIFLGLILLTYLFFIIGIFKLLYFNVLFMILLILLFLVIKPRTALVNFKAVLITQCKRIKKAPWKIILLVILGGMLFYNLSYCFIPATHIDGSGDIVNSFLPILNYYIISHSFEAAIHNATYGINSQAFDVLRTITKIFIGEPGVYLLSFIYLLLLLGGIYLIGKEIFNMNSMLIYLVALLLLYKDIFTEAIHFGKLHTTALSFLIISLYSIRFSDHDKNYILPALFFGFLASQYIHFAVIALVYYSFIYFILKHKTMEAFTFRLIAKSLLIFCILFLIFNLKLIAEVGICFPPAMIPTWLSNLFLQFNQNNGLYKYIDNNYMRNFYIYNWLSLETVPLQQITLMKKIFSIYHILEFKYIFLFLPLLLLKRNKFKILYILETMAIMGVMFVMAPLNRRLSLYYIYPLAILQFAIFNNFWLKLNYYWLKPVSSRIRFVLMRSFISMILFVIFFDVASAMTYRKPVFLKELFVHYIRPNYIGSAINRLHKEIFPVFYGQKPKYQYLQTLTTPKGWAMFDAYRNFDHAMLIRQHTEVTDTILIVPVRFHSHTMRRITARHALGSVIYQRDINKIMADLKKLNINYLSTMPINYRDYNPFYTPVFEEDTFYKYFKLLFSGNGSNFYEIIYDGTNEIYTPSPYDVRGLLFVPMLKEEKV